MVCLMSLHTSCLCSLLSAPIARPVWISVTCVLLTFPVYKAHVFPLLSLPAGSATQCAFVPVIPVCFVGPQISGQWLFWFKWMALFLSLWIFFFCQCRLFTKVWPCCLSSRSVVWQLKNTAELNPFACTAFTLGPNHCFRCSWHTLSQNHSQALEMKSHFFLIQEKHASLSAYLSARLPTPVASVSLKVCINIPKRCPR